MNDSIVPEVHHTQHGTPYLKGPGVSLVAQPQFSPMAATDFINSFGGQFDAADYENDWYDAPEVDYSSMRWPMKLDHGSSLCKLAGQLCYMSFGEKRTRNDEAAKYFENIKAQAHGCYDVETEVLTKGGWKRWPDVTEQDEMATINENAEIEYHRPRRLIRYQHVGRMYRVESRGVDLLVTPDHKMLACVTTTRKGRKREEYSLIKAEDLDSTSHAYLKCGTWRGGSAGVISSDVAALLGFAIGDGYVPTKNRVRFHLRRERKIVWLRRLVQRLDWSLIEDGDNYTVWLPDDEKICNIFAGIYDNDREKVIPFRLLTDCNEEVLLGLFEGLMQADGHRGKTGDSFDTTSQTLAGQFQQLCLHIGLAANVVYTYDAEDRPTSYGTKPLTRLSIVSRELKPEVNKFIDSVGKTSWIDSWSGEVFCAEVPNNTLYVRRNGKPVWSGNSVLEHANYSFLIWGIDRACSHELVRHRSGMAYSQLSQRYVSGKLLRFVERPEYQQDERLHAMFEEWIDRAAGEYDLRANDLKRVINTKGMTPTEARKAVNQAARNCLPNETETAMVVTGNARAWRHVIEMRASKHADKPIRELAGGIASILLSAAPNLFDDYEWEAGVSWTQYRKV